MKSINLREEKMGNANLDTDYFWKLQGSVQMLLEVVRHSHGNATSAHRETECICASGCKLFDYSCMRSSCVRRDDSHTGKKTLKTEPFSVWEPLFW
jgi:hypothetical protein